jgi:hypothetical protein
MACTAAELDEIVLEITHYIIVTWGSKVAVEPRQWDLRQALEADEDSWMLEITALKDHP